MKTDETVQPLCVTKPFAQQAAESHCCVTIKTDHVAIMINKEH